MTAGRLDTGTLVLGKLRVVRLLGAGGMAAVYEVEHQLTKHRRALKLLHPEMLKHPSIVARFLREASAAGHIGNQHVVETFDAGSLEGGEPYIVMEMLVGEPLADRFRRERRLPVADLADIVSQACEGIHAAHATGIVHRDLKPDNLFLQNRRGSVFVKVLDFGISKFDPALTGGPGMTKEGATIGTPYYMSPEQVAGMVDVDGRVDVYALGVILYEGAAGVRPFEADALPMLSVLIHEGKPKPLGEVRPDLPPAFVDVVSRAMATDRDERYASAKELAADLAPFRAAAFDATIPDGTVGIAGAAAAPPRAVVRSSAPPPDRPTGPPAPTPPGATTLPSAPPPTPAPAPTAAMAGAPPKWSPAASTSGAARSVADDAPRSPRRGALVWLAVAICAVALGIAIKREVAPAAAPSPPTGLVQAPPAPSTAPPPPQASEPAAAPTSAAVAAPPVPDASAPIASTARPASLPPSRSSAKPAGSTRVDQKGLAGDNPF